MTLSTPARAKPPGKGATPGPERSSWRHDALGPTARRTRDDMLGGKRVPGTESTWGVIAAFGYVVAVVVLLAFGFDNTKPTFAGLLLLPVFVALVTPVIRWTAKGVTSLDLRGILYLGFALRVIGAVIRFQFFAADSLVYNEEGTRIATYLRNFDFAVNTGRQIPGTGSVRYMTGITHVLTFDETFGSFLVFTTLSFIGACLFIKAFEIGLPTGDLKRYGLLLALMPSLIFWPSSIGKEALMMFSIGLTSLGTAKLVRQQWGSGALLAILGLIGAGLIRPHVALIALLAICTTVFVPRQRKSNMRFAARIFVVMLALIGGSFLARETASRFNSDDRTGETVDVDNALENAADKTSQGGSAFQPARVRTPLDYPLAFGTVYFRPLPNEARDINGIISSAEAAVLFGLLLASLRRYRHLWSTIKANPYVAYAIAFVLAFAFAFSAIGNFGILVRQRTQAAPLLLVLLALPAVRSSDDDAGDGADETQWRTAGVSPSPSSRNVEVSTSSRNVEAPTSRGVADRQDP